MATTRIEFRRGGAAAAAAPPARSFKQALLNATLPLTLIEWADATLNPILGCEIVTRECRVCYAPPVMVRQAGFGREAHAQVVSVVKGIPVWNGEVVWNSRDWRRDIARFAARGAKLGRPLRVFVASLSDLFHPLAIGRGMTLEVYRAMRDNPGPHYIILTKRPESAEEFYLRHPEFAMLPGVWVGVSVGIQEAVGRIDILRRLPVEQRVVSFEPLLERLDVPSLAGIDWMIIGGESAPDKRRPVRMDPAWAEELLDLGLRDGAAVFYKQTGTVLAKELKLRGKGGGPQALLRGQRWTHFPVPPAEARRQIAALRAEVAWLRGGRTEVARAARTGLAEHRAAAVWPRVRDLIERGLDNEAAARALTAARVPTPTGEGTRWFGAQVARVRRRMEGAAP